MTIKKLMVPFFEEETANSAFCAAATIAKEFKAHLDVVHIRQRISPSLPGNIYYPVAVTYVEENLEKLQKAADRNAVNLNRRFEKFCSDWSITVLQNTEHTDDKGATASWTDIEKDLPFHLAVRARVADVTVLARPSDPTPHYTMDLLEEAIFQSGRSVLIVGQQATITKFPETVMVAWDGGREAARAVHEALPLLRRAETVIVAAMGEIAFGAEAPESIAAYLRLHGVHANSVHSSLDKHEEAEELFLKRAKSESADLVVMGAYSHSRWREMVLGGFTRFMLRHTDIPVLMAH